MNEDEHNTTEEQEEVASEPEAIEVTISDLELESLRREAEDFKTKYLQLLADAENSRKRLQKDRDEIVQYALRGVITEFLHPIDHMENALKYTEEASDEVKHWATGFQMILSQFRDALANNNVHPVDSIGKEFDPHIHEAVETIQTDDHPPGIVVEESIRGYKIGEKTLRPARVKVSEAPKSNEE